MNGMQCVDTLHLPPPSYSIEAIQGIVGELNKFKLVNQT